MGGDRVFHRLSSVKIDSTVTKICRSVLPGISVAESTPLLSFPDRKASSSPSQTGLAFLCFQFSLKYLNQEPPDWEKAREEFVSQWGSLGTQWGINRTMAMIHALLMTSPEPLCTDEVMEKLQISRGNAHTNLKDLVGWNLVRIVTKRGDRKEYFEAEKDVWKIFITIAKERKRREIEPAIHLLRECAAKTKDETAGPGREFHQQMKNLDEFLSFGVKVGDTVISMKHASALQWAMRLLS